MSPTTIPRFLLPRGAPSSRTINALTRQHQPILNPLRTASQRCASSSSKNNTNSQSDKRVLEKPDKFRPPSHPARRVVQTRNGRVVNAAPVNYPGPKLSEKEKEEQKTREYPGMFPPEGTVMHKFLTSRWIHIWIAMGVLTSLATFTFTTNFKATSPFAHLLPPWSALLTNPFSTISQAISVFRMHVEHNSIETREKRRRRVDDAEKRRQYRIAHGLEEPTESELQKESADAGAAAGVDDQSPVAVEAQGQGQGQAEYVDWEGKKKPVKKWLGIW